ncbi:UDP-N-acetylmuramate dehydrogenase [Candidatus Dependentiae bacterium]|nr:UDP-N-acetylmuramate dehydrogenase [Candidatus Dependentiae bacterium]
MITTRHSTTNPLQQSLIQEHITLKDKNWFQTGGVSHYFAEPTTIQEFSQALLFSQENKIPLFILGQGANILVSDHGFDGLTIRPRLNAISHKEQGDTALVHAQAGVTIHDLIEYCLNHHIIGLEEFSGIPGTVGGSVYINLHYFQFFLAQFLHKATVMHRADGTIHQVSKEWFNFGYDTSTLQQQEFYLVDATFILKKTSALEAMYARGRRAEIIRHRLARYPSTHTCGSFFRNFHPDEVPYFIEGSSKKLIFVAYYLDKIGVKGSLRVGNAAVSHQHANMLINIGDATSHDIITLARTMQELVYEKFGILPQPECQLIGFHEYPLLTI